MPMILQDWWYTTLLDLPYPFQAPLCEAIKADALVVGAGAAGLAAALRLSESGVKDVVLIDRNICGEAPRAAARVFSPRTANWS